MEASKSLSCENNNSSLFSALPESSNMYSNKDSNLISVLYVGYFPPVFTFSIKNGVGSFLPFISLNNLLPFLNQWDYNFGTSLQRSWICIFIVCLFISWGIRAFRCEVIILSTLIAPHVVTISTYPRVRLGPRFFSSPIDFCLYSYL